MEKMKMQSLDVVGSNIEKIKSLFPACITEKMVDGKVVPAIDFEKLQAELCNDIVGAGEERYQFTWPDKRKAIREANTPTTMTLRPCREESVDFDNTQNLYIEGDNLEVLKVLRETYLGKVKMIYIDPPYNTGNDFVYNDDFAKTRADFEEMSGLFDEEGNQTVDPMVRNTESNGRFHTDWLNMMYPRLKVARDLLTDDGVIFISIDDNEADNLRKICNEIFGEENFRLQIAWRRTDNQPNIGLMARVKEYILVYSKSNLLSLGRLPLTEKAKAEYRYSDAKGLFRRSILLDKTRGRKFYPKVTKLGNTLTGPWMVSEEEFDRMDANNEIYWTENGDGQPYGKIYLSDTKGQIPNDFWGIEFGTNQRGSLEVEKLFEHRYFDFPKPVSLLGNLTMLGTNKGSIILDFFSGSATTAHAVMQLNAEDEGQRRFIMVQLPELTDEKSEAYKAGYENICEIGKERIRRAGKKILEEKGVGKLKQEIDALIAQRSLVDNDFWTTPQELDKMIENKEKELEKLRSIDTGFRVLKLDSSNMEEVYYTPEKFDASMLFVDNVKPDRTDQDLLFQTMLDLGIELSAKIESKQMNGKTVHIVDDNYLVTCFDENINESTITEIAKMKPIYFVMRDASASNDNVIDNFEQIFRHYSPDTNCRII